MENCNLIVMGSTGAGKSTLINAVLGVDLAPTGVGSTITRVPKLYSKDILLPEGYQMFYNCHEIPRKLNLYDTVGLEIDHNITEQTLQNVKRIIQKAQEQEGNGDITLVWFCMNYSGQRFQPFERELIHKLSMEYEIPFVLVLTQCFTNKENNLEREIRHSAPEFPIVRIMAKDYHSPIGTINAYGIPDLLQRSVKGFIHDKTKILKEKQNQLQVARTRRIEELRVSGQECIAHYASTAAKTGILPVGCIPFVHGICIKMLNKLEKLMGINASKGFGAEVFANVIVGFVCTPFMLVPGVSALVAYSYVGSVGEAYLESLLAVISRSTDNELLNSKLMEERIIEELKKYKN